MSGILVLLGIAVLLGAAMVRWWAPPPSSVRRSLDFDYTSSVVTAEASFISDLRSKAEVGPPHAASSGWPHLRGHSRCVQAAWGPQSFSMPAGLLHHSRKPKAVAAVMPHCNAVIVLQARWLRPGQHFSVELDLILAEPPASFVLQVTGAACRQHVCRCMQLLQNTLCHIWEWSEPWPSLCSPARALHLHVHSSPKG